MTNKVIWKIMKLTVDFWQKQCYSYKVASERGGQEQKLPDEEKKFLTTPRRCDKI